MLGLKISTLKPEIQTHHKKLCNEAAQMHLAFQRAGTRPGFCPVPKGLRSLFTARTLLNNVDS